VARLPDPRTEPTVSVERAGACLGISRASAYDAVRRGEIPAIRLGRRWVVPTAHLRRLLGLEPASDGATPKDDGDDL
jgi:excisionase family DNA binding protein